MVELRQQAVATKVPIRPDRSSETCHPNFAQKSGGSTCYLYGTLTSEVESRFCHGSGIAEVCQELFQSGGYCVSIGMKPIELHLCELVLVEVQPAW